MADDAESVLEQTVDELREALPEYEGDLEALLEQEEQGKNRKTAKQAIKEEVARRDQIEEQLSPSGETSEGKTVHEASLGELKIVQHGSKPPQLVCEIGDVEVPLDQDMLRGAYNKSASSGGAAGNMPLLMLAGGGGSQPGLPGTSSGSDTGAGTGSGAAKDVAADGVDTAESTDAADTTTQEEAEEGTDTAAEQDGTIEESGEAGETESAEPGASSQQAQQIRRVLQERYGKDADVLAEKDAGELQQMLEREVEKERLIHELEEYYGQDPDELEDESLDALQELRDELKEEVSTEDEDVVHDHEETGQEVERGLRLLDEMDLPNLKEEFKDELQEEEEDGEEEESEGGFKKIFSFFQKADTPGRRDPEDVVRDALEQCQNIENYDAATTVLAHVLKQYLEIKMRIRRELTYLEVVKELEKGRLQSEYVEDLKEFYRDMHLQTYKGDARVDFNNAYQLAQHVVDEL